MPALRSSSEFPNFKLKVQSNVLKPKRTPRKLTTIYENAQDEITFKGEVLSGAERKMHYPLTDVDRNAFRTASGKKLTPHEWAVYDLTLQIPRGKVSTYKYLCAVLGEGSPRSVGSALRKNPFAPYVPCHRVIASDLSLGGFLGEWGTENQEGSMCSRKIELLKSENIMFDGRGKVLGRDSVVWTR